MRKDRRFSAAHPPAESGLPIFQATAQADVFSFRKNFLITPENRLQVGFDYVIIHIVFETALWSSG